jgi:hypothetical protein
VLLQKIGDWLSFVKFSLGQWLSTIEIRGVDISALRDQQLGNGPAGSRGRRHAAE